VVRGDRRQYYNRHPGPEDIGLIVEVSDTTLQRDRTLKKQLYARVAIPVYWIINLSERQIESYTEPTGPSNQPDYAQRQLFCVHDQIMLVLDGQTIAPLTVASLLP
jgi:Uma2 family endonuclease